VHGDRCPTKPGIATCSRPPGTLRAGFAGGLQPCLTATARIAIRNVAGTEKRPDIITNKETWIMKRDYWNIGSFAIDSSDGQARPACACHGIQGLAIGDVCSDCGKMTPSTTPLSPTRPWLVNLPMPLRPMAPTRDYPMSTRDNARIMSSIAQPEVVPLRPAHRLKRGG
jgi:hypothetical protein